MENMFKESTPFCVLKLLGISRMRIMKLIQICKFIIKEFFTHLNYTKA